MGVLMKTRRAFILSLGGIIIIVIAIFRLSQTATSFQPRERSSPTTQTRPTEPIKGARALGRRDADTHVALGDISTVPFQELYHLLSSRSPEQIAELARQLEALPPGAGRDAKIATFFKVWAAIDAKLAVTKAAAIGDRPGRSAAVASIVESVAPSSADAVVEAIVELPSTALAEKTALLSKALIKWSQADPSEAAKFMDRDDTKAAFSDASLGPRPDLAVATTWTSIGENFGAKDPQAAMEWAKRALDSGTSQFAIQGAIRGWWQKEPEAAADYVTAHANEALGQQMATNLATSMALLDSGRAMVWVDRLPNAEARQQALSGVIEVMSHSDPATAARMIQDFPPGIQQTMALGTLVSGWTEKDPQSVARWIGTLSGAPQDEAVTIFTSFLSSQDAPSALIWAQNVNDSAKRQRYVQQIAQRWLQQDPVAAKAWIQGSSLSSDQKINLLGLAPERSGGLTKTLARELASRGITVNAVAPGFITTDMTDVLSDQIKEAVLPRIPLGKFGEGADIAAAVAFLASPEAKYITGQVLTVDGGMVM